MFEPGVSPPSEPPLRTRGERMLRFTPLDLRQRRFDTVLRGFDRNQVARFLSEVADDFEQALQQLDLLQQELLQLETYLHEQKQREDNLRNTLLTAQKLADEIRDTAEKEARIVAREAEARADMLLEKAHTRLEEVEREISELRLKRRNVEGTLEASINSLQMTLEFIRSQERSDRDDRILLHRPRSVDTSSANRKNELTPDADRRAEGES